MTRQNSTPPRRPTRSERTRTRGVSVTWLFLSGIGPRVKGQRDIPGVTLDDDGGVVEHDIELQCHAVFRNVRTVLEASGSSWDRLVDVTVFLTDMQGDFDRFNKVYAEYFATNRPCRTTVKVTALPTPIAVELKCVATIREASTDPGEA